MNKLLKRIYHFLTLKILFPWQYKRYSKQPLVRQKVVFIEANLPKLSNSLRFLYQELENAGTYEIHVHYLREAFVGKGAYIRNVMNCLRDAGDAAYIILCEGSRPISCIRPRQEVRIIQLWHGCGAFKKFGFSTTQSLFGGSQNEYLKYSYYRNFDCVTISSPQVAWAYEEAMNLEQGSPILQPIGISRTDIFFKEEFINDAFSHLYKRLPMAEGKKVILYAPTFRGSVGNAKTPDALDIGAMARALSDEYVLLIKHHPVVKIRPEISKEHKGSFAVDVSDIFDIDELLCVSDLCISDYSSLVFEYSLFERPILFFAYDLEDYIDWRGFYYDYEELTPGPVVRTTEEIITCIQNQEEYFESEKIRAFKQKFMSACDGNATARIRNRFILEEGEFR